MNIRLFKWTDIEQFTNLVNLVQGIADHPRGFSVDYMRESLNRPGGNPELNCLVAETNQLIVGYAILVPEKPIGRVVVEGGVLPAYRFSGVGEALLEATLSLSVKSSVNVVHISVAQNNQLSQNFLEQRNFSKVRTHHEMRWKGNSVHRPPLPSGFDIRSFRIGDELLLTQLQNAAFNQSWGFCPNSVEEIAYRTRLSRCDPDGIIFITKDTEAAAYCWTTSSENSNQVIGVISMTGVSPSYRGLGLGQIVLLEGMRHLSNQKGARTIELSVDSENRPALLIYKSAGFQVASETIWYERNLSR